MNFAGLGGLLVATIASIELLRATHLFPAFRRLSTHGRRATRLLMRTGVSEWAKERALALASRRMFALSFDAAGRLLLVTAPFILIVALDRWHPFGLASAWTDWPARIWLLLLTTLYVIVRRLRGQGDRAFQRVALGYRPLIEMSFDMERAVHRRHAAAIPLVAPVFVTGLARSGTSVLTRALHGEAGFASLSYRDLPFPLAPNLWRRFSESRSRSIATVERGHGDGLLHDLDSPEAIEEIFWLAHEGDRYRQADHILPVPPRPETGEAFRDYVRLVLLSKGSARYLSKNNANILRLPGLVQAFPDAILIHPFRDPLQQAASLLRQHLRARALAADDPYRARFMGWLGHHEFGADHRPFRFSGAARPTSDPAQLDYWLERWIEAYRFLLAQPETVRVRQTFVDYDGLCRNPAALSRPLGRLLGLDSRLPLDQIHAPSTQHAVIDHTPALQAEARRLHAELIHRSAMDLGITD